MGESENTGVQDGPTPDLDEAIDKIARFIVRFGLTVPAILAIEGMRPLSFVGSQFMHMLSPSIGAVLTTSQWDALARLLEHRRGVDVILARIEELDRVDFLRRAET